MKKSTLYTGILGFGLAIGVIILINSLVISNTQPSDCTLIQAKITKIIKGPGNDIVFKSSNSKSYYINRGMKRDLNLDSLKTKVLNKTVTLHVANILDEYPSKHISQITVKRDTIFTEF